MFIVSENRKEIFNTDGMENIFVSKDGKSVKICYMNGGTRGGTLGVYNSFGMTEKAVSVLVKRMAINSEIVYMPLEQEVKPEYDTWHHATGKKTKGHGSS